MEEKDLANYANEGAKSLLNSYFQRPNILAYALHTDFVCNV